MARRQQRDQRESRAETTAELAPALASPLPNFRQNAARPLTRHLAHSVKTTLLEHALLLAVVGAYFVSVALFLAATGHLRDWTVRWGYWPLWLLLGVGAAAQVLIRRRAFRLNHLAGALLVTVLAAPFQSTFNSVKQVIDEVPGYRWDERLADIDRWLHFGRQPWEWLAPLVERQPIILFFDLTYVLWFPVLFAFLVWLSWCDDRELRLRALLSTVLLWAVCGNLAALMFSSAGPCYYGAVAGGANPFGALMAVLDRYHEQTFLFARFNQSGLWNAMQSHTWLPFGGISAMPSVHVAMAVLMALVARVRNATAGMLLAVFALLTLLGSVVLGWHYAIDGYVGAVVALATWAGVRNARGMGLHR